MGRRGEQPPAVRWGIIAIRALAALLAVAVLGITAAYESGVLEDPPRVVSVVFIVVVALLGVRDNVVTVYRRVREKSTLKMHQDRDRAIVNAAIAIADDNPALSVSRLGVSVWVVKRGGKRDEYLHRVRRWRSGPTPYAADVDWTKRKGVLGQCWQDGAPVYRNVAATAQKYRGVILTEDQWRTDDPPASVRAGMTLEDFNQMSGKYAEVWAVPIKDDTLGTLLGVLTLDLQYGSRINPNQPMLNTDEVRGTLEVAAALVLRAGLKD